MNSFSVAVTCVAGITFYVGLSHLIYYLRSRARRELLPFSLTCFSIALYDVFCAGLYEAETHTEGMIWQRGQFIALTLLSIFILWFVLRFVHRRYSKVDIALTLFYVLWGVLIVLGKPSWTVTDKASIKPVILGGEIVMTYFEAKHGFLAVVEGILGLGSGCYLMFMLVQQFRRGHRGRIGPVLLGMAILALAAVNDTLVGMGLYNSLYLIEYGFMFLILGMVYSLTWTHVQTQTNLKMSRDEQTRLAAAVSEAAESIMVTDENGAILYVNPFFERMTGYTSEDVVGKTPGMLSSGKQSSEFYEAMWETISKGETWHGHFANRRKDGTLYEEEATISPVRDGSGKVVNYVAVKRDVTQEIELENQLRQSQKMEAVGQLARKVAHDFTNLLVAIFGNAQMLKNRLPPGTQDQKHLDEIINAANRASSMTSELLAFAHNQPAEMKNADLNRVVRSAEDILKSTIGREYELVMHAHPQPLIAKVDRSQIEQIIVQLVINAREAMGNIGKLTLETRAVNLTPVDASQLGTGLPERDRTSGEFAVIQVSDTGCGMDEETQHRVFEPFFTTRDEKVSSGLGLSTVYGIVEQHDGHITVYSEPGVGTTFTIYLPLVDAGNKGDCVDVTGNGKAVLLLEGHYVPRHVLSGVFQEFGFRVLEAEDVVQAAALADQHGDGVALIVCDMVLMTGDCAVVFEGIRNQVPGAKVLATCGFGSHHVGRIELIPAGTAWIAAPFSRDTVAGPVAGLLAGDKA